MSPDQQEAIKKIAKEEGFDWKGIDDPVHFESDPMKHGYKSRKDAIKENQADYKKQTQSGFMKLLDKIFGSRESKE